MKVLLMTLGFTIGLAACGAVEGDPGLDAEEQMALNEGLAVSRLKTVAAAQVQAQSLALVDSDGDGQGEYAYLAELSGRRKVRVGEGVKTPLLSTRFTGISAGGYVAVDGYLYRVFLPGPEGDLVGEELMPGEEARGDEAESKWVCYAWPESYGVTGKRTFVIDQEGKVRAREDAKLSGAPGPVGTEGYEVDEDGAVERAWPIAR